MTTTATPTSEPAKKRRGPGKPFQKGDPRIAPLARAAEAAGLAPPKPPPPARVEVEGEGLLADYRFVWENDKAHDDTPKRKTLRKLLADDPRGFVKDLRDLEKAAAQAGGGAAKADIGVDPGATNLPPAPDLGTASCLELIDQLLGESE